MIGQNRRTLSSLLAWIGLFSLLLAAFYYAVLNRSDAPLFGLLGVAVLLLAASVALYPDVVVRAVLRPRFHSGVNILASVVILALILGLVNFLADRYSQRLDLTANRFYSLSDVTLKVLSEIKQPIDVYAFYTQGDPGRVQAQDLLKEYSTKNPNLRVRFVDPDQEPGLAREFGVTASGTTVFKSGDRTQQTLGSSEIDFTGALVRLANPGQRKVYFLTGHGEHGIDDFSPTGYSQLKATLEKFGYLATNLNLMTSPSVPDDAIALVVASPRQPLLEQEKKAIAEYLDRGGDMIVMAEPRIGTNPPPSLNDLVERYGVKFTDGIILDPERFAARDIRLTVIAEYEFTTITTGLQGLATVFPTTAAVVTTTETVTGAIRTLFTRTSQVSWVTTDPASGTFDPQRGDLRGPLANAATVDYKKPGTEAEPNAPDTRIVLIGDSDFATNQFVSQVPANMDFFLNAVNWLTSSQELLGIAPKTQETRSVFLTSTQQNLVFVSSTLAIPLLVLAAGGVVWWRRR
jgi:ABC-type uncharacterized transport system involved in gliding motility auxiliary subunit